MKYLLLVAVVAAGAINLVNSILDTHDECNKWAFDDNQCIENPRLHLSIDFLITFLCLSLE